MGRSPRQVSDRDVCKWSRRGDTQRRQTEDAGVVRVDVSLGLRARTVSVSSSGVLSRYHYKLEIQLLANVIIGFTRVGKENVNSYMYSNFSNQLLEWFHPH